MAVAMAFVVASHVVAPTCAGAQVAEQRMQPSSASIMAGGAGGALPNPQYRLDNPASLRFLEGALVGVSAYYAAAVDARGTHVYAAAPLGRFVLGVDVREQHVTNLFERELVESGAAPADPYVGDVAVRATVAAALPRLELGASAEYLGSSVLASSGRAWLGAVGLRVPIGQRSAVGLAYSGFGSAYVWQTPSGRRQFAGTSRLTLSQAWRSAKGKRATVEVGASQELGLDESGQRPLAFIGTTQLRYQVLSGGIALRTDATGHETRHLSAGIGFTFGRAVVRIAQADLLSDVGARTMVDVSFGSRVGSVH